MSSTADNSKKFSWPLVVAVLVLIPILYVASVGPAIYLCLKTQAFQGSKMIYDMYKPVMMFGLKNSVGPSASPFGFAYFKYVGWWSGFSSKDAHSLTKMALSKFEYTY